MSIAEANEKLNDMPETIQHTVPVGIENLRLSEYLIGLFPQTLTRNSAKKAMKRGAIFHNHRIGHSGNWVTSGDTIAYRFTHEPKLKPFPLSLTVIYEDDYVAIIDKPAGIMVNGNAFRTLENALPNNLTPSSQKDALGNMRAVHRLDAPTRGLLLVAKTQKALAGLGKLFEECQVKKEYKAIVQGETPNEITFQSLMHGKSAISRLVTLQRYFAVKWGNISLVALSPETGRKHQLRIHLARAGYPIIGEEQYDSKGNLISEKTQHQTLYLLASSLEFVHPITEEPLHFSLSLPKKFTKLLRHYTLVS